MWIVCSRNRPHLIERLFSKTMPTTPGVIAIDEDQAEMYAATSLPEGWKLDVSKRNYFGPKNNDVFSRYPNEPWYGSINDDMLPETPGWDSILPEASGPWGIAWGDDKLGGRAVCVAFGGELIRALGWICCPGVYHFFNDDVHELIARELGIGKYIPEVIVPHLHFSKGAEYDETYKSRPSHGADRARFQYWRDNQWPQMREHLKMLIATYSPSSAS